MSFLFLLTLFDCFAVVNLAKVYQWKTLFEDTALSLVHFLFLWWFILFLFEGQNERAQMSSHLLVQFPQVGAHKETLHVQWHGSSHALRWTQSKPSMGTSYKDHVDSWLPVPVSAGHCTCLSLWLPHLEVPLKLGKGQGPFKKPCLLLQCGLQEMSEAESAGEL